MSPGPNRFERDAATRLRAAMLDLTAAGRHDLSARVLDLLRELEPPQHDHGLDRVTGRPTWDTER